VTLSPSTRTVEVYDALRAELLNGLLAPDQKLRMVELGRRFGVSQSVVREALTRLTEQGLVVSTPQRGFRVRDLSVQDIAELTETRVEIESVALRLAIQRGDVHWETGILSARHLLERMPAVKDDGTVNEEWSANHREFHRALLAGCGNAQMQGIAQALRDSAELYRRWCWVLTDDHDRDVATEHRQLQDFALARDTDAAVELLVEHIKQAPYRLIAYAQQHGLDNFHPATDRPA
jgi:DNA-binding GntR family transcriptional regulator